MLLSNLRPTTRSRILWVAATLACTTESVLVAITVTLAIKNAPPGESIYRIALAASFADIILMPALIVLAYLAQRPMTRRINLLSAATAVPLALVAATLTLYAMIFLRNGGSDRDDDDQFTQALATAGFAMWALAIVFETTLFTAALYLEAESYRSDMPVQQTATMLSPPRTAKRSSSRTNSISLPSPVTITNPDAPPVSSAFSAYSTSPRSSFRYSISKVIRPVTSKTKLLLQHSFVLHDVNASSPGRLTPSELRERTDGFENWDAPPQNHTKAFRNFSKRRLETIPGSRSVSPANALYGPFPWQPSSPVETPTQPLSAASSLIALSRSQSTRGQSEPATSQAHIHPLFRSESPVPCPVVTSPGTVVTAEVREHALRRWHSATSAASGRPARMHVDALERSISPV